MCCRWAPGPRPGYMGGHSDAWSITSAASNERGGEEESTADPREGHPADPEGASLPTLHPPNIPPISHPCSTAAPTWTPPLSIPPEQMKTLDGAILQALKPHPRNPISHPCTHSITPRPPQAQSEGAPQSPPPHPPASPSVWGVPWAGGSVGRMTSWVGGSWERGKTGCMVLGMEAGKAGGRFWCSAGWPMPGEGGEGQRGAVSSGVRGAAPCSRVPPVAPTVGVPPHPDGGAAGAGQPVRVRRVCVGSRVPPELPCWQRGAPRHHQVGGEVSGTAPRGVHPCKLHELLVVPAGRNGPRWHRAPSGTAPRSTG